MNHLTQARELLNQLNLVVNKSRLPFWTSNSKAQAELEGLCNSYKQLESAESGSEMEFQLSGYTGSNKNVLSLIQSLRSAKPEFIESVILQGSLASDEEVEYSDFDAMVVLNSKAFQSPEHLKNAVKTLWKLYQNIVSQDILQHHGWFVTTTDLLSVHFDDFFPAAIFKKSCILYSASEQNSLKLCIIQEKHFYQEALSKTAHQIISEIESGKHVSNTYNLKSCLSKIMLLPSLYYQSSRLEGVYKGDSFQLVKPDFTEKEWDVMEFVSELRKNWTQPEPYWLRLLAVRFPSMSRKLVKRFASSVSTDLKKTIEQKQLEMLTFVKLTNEKAKQFKA